jgi:hypothetical protein
MNKNDKIGIALALGIIAGGAGKSEAEDYYYPGYVKAGFNYNVDLASISGMPSNSFVEVIHSPTNGVLDNLSGAIFNYKADANAIGDDYYSVRLTSNEHTNSVSFGFKLLHHDIPAKINGLVRSNDVSLLSLSVQPGKDGKRVTNVYRSQRAEGPWNIVGSISNAQYLPNGLVNVNFVDSSTNDSGFYRLQTVGRD